MQPLSSSICSNLDKTVSPVYRLLQYTFGFSQSPHFAVGTSPVRCGSHMSCHTVVRYVAAAPVPLSWPGLSPRSSTAGITTHTLDFQSSPGSIGVLDQPLSAQFMDMNCLWTRQCPKLCARTHLRGPWLAHACACSRGLPTRTPTILRPASDVSVSRRPA